MSNVVRQGVEGIGISPSFPELCQKSDAYFTEVAIPETVRIPDIKPEMEELLSVMVDAKIVSLRIINTPIGKSQEGQVLTGKKLSIELELRQKVKYIANEPTQSVHAAHFEKKVSSLWIVVPKTVCVDGKEIPIETLLLQGKLNVKPYIEDIYGEQLDRRTIFKNITVLINVTFNTCESCAACDPCGPCISEVCEAKLVTTMVADKSTITHGTGTATDIVTYTVTVENIGGIDATNVSFMDIYTSIDGNGNWYINPPTYPFSITVDGIAITPAVNPQVSSLIGVIPRCKTAIIKYSMQGTDDIGTVENYAQFIYKVKPGDPDTTLKSNTITTTII